MKAEYEVSYHELEQLYTSKYCIREMPNLDLRDFRYLPEGVAGPRCEIGPTEGS